MFDVKKIRRLAALLEKIPNEFENVYVVPEYFTREMVALFKRLKLPIRALMHDEETRKEFFGIPVLKTAEASANFNERTLLIILVKKPVPLIQTTFNVKVSGGLWSLPALVISGDEAIAVYNHLLILKMMRLYEEDGLSDIKNPSTLANKFAQGLTTMLNPSSQSFKYELLDIRHYSKPRYDFDDTAIVIQGPIAYDNNYTVETFKLYRSIYPNVPIIVSTWKGESNSAFRKECKDNSIVLLENDPPPSPGLFNVDMQLKSSFQGVKYVCENTNAKFVLKTRTDQRINYFSFLVYFKNLLETFPPNGDKLNQRIIFLGGDDTRAYPFHPHDFLSFGHVRDIFKMYDIPFHGDNGKLGYKKRHKERLDKINRLVNATTCRFNYDMVTEQSRKLYKLNKMMNRIYWPEMWLTRTFYEKYIAPVDATKLYETSWKFTVDYLILIDFDIIKLDWFKYEDMRYRPGFSYSNNDAFARWLDMYRNFKIDWV